MPARSQFACQLRRAHLILAGATLAGSSLGQAKLTKLHDVHPGSFPNAFTGTENGSHLFLGEGGQIAFIDAHALPPATGSGFLPAATKLVQVGKLGAVPADLLLDPALDLDVDADSDGIDENDYNDLLFIAAGHMGLWVMSANTMVGQPNPVVRLDDQEDPAQPQSIQTSRRFCNQLSIVTVGPTRFLAVTFAEKAGSMLRLYDLAAIHTLMFNGASETGAEIDPFVQIPLGARTLVPASVSPRTFGASYSVGLAVDQEIDPVPQNESADIFVAMNTHGLLRVHLDPVLVPGSNPPKLASIQSALAWGPVFGTGTPYATPGSGAQGPYPADRYENLHLYDITRSVRYDELLRFDPPAFLDVAVQDDVNGHYIYTAVDHLNWVRFNLANPWSNSMVIHHHEGVEILAPSSVSWSGQAIPSAWGGRKHIRPVNLNFTQPALTGDDWIYARRLEMVKPPLGSLVTGPVLVVTYGAIPWAQLSDIVAPRPTYGHSFYGVGGVPLDTGSFIGHHEVCTTFYDVSNLTTHYTGAIGNDLGFIEAGGGVVWAPRNQDPLRTGSVNTLLVLHDGVSYIHGSMLQMESQGACASYIDMLAGVHGAPSRFYQRNEDELLGRYTFSIGWSEANPRVLYTGANDNQEIEHDGALWTRLEPNGEYSIQRSGYSPAAPNGDRRMVLGLNPSDDCEWGVMGISAPEAWFVGRAEQPLAVPAPGQLGTINWGFFQYLISNGAPPTVTLVNQWFLGYPGDRWNRLGRPGGYDVASTNTESYSDWVGLQFPNAVAKNLAFFNRAGTPDSSVAANRNLMQTDLSTLPSGSGAIVPWRQPWSVSALNCHPEYDAMPNDLGDSAYITAQSWWNVAGPPMIDQANTLAWHANTIHFPVRPSGGEKWLLTIPCFYLTHAPTLHAEALAKSSTEDVAFSGWFDPAGGTPPPGETQVFMNAFDHGLVQFWEISNPDAIHFQPINTATPQPFGYPRGSSTLPHIVFPDAGSAAFDVSTVTITTTAGIRVLLVCTDFGGRVLVYDITTLPEGGTPVLDASWTPPPRLLDDALYFAPNSNSPTGRSLQIVWSVVADEPTGSMVRIYAAVHDYGIVSLTLDDIDPTNGFNFEFIPTEEVRVETGGNPFRLRIRPSGSHGPKSLLVSDAMGGLRVYGPQN